MSGLSKTRMMAFLQCPKRLWLEKHRPELAEIDADRQARFDTGRAVGDIARKLYDPHGAGTRISGEDGMSAALRDTASALTNAATTPLFEATFERDGLLVRTDVIERSSGGEESRLIEVKSATQIKDEYAADCAIQAWVLESSPVRPQSVALAHIDGEFTYEGDGDYDGLLAEADLTDELAPQLEQIPGWLNAAKSVVEGPEPAAPIGSRCTTPYTCPFMNHCWPKTEYPLTTLPGLSQQRLDEFIAQGYKDLRELPTDLVGRADAQRVWRAARSGKPEISREARSELAALSYPRYYLDFETIGPAIPFWPGTRPYVQIPFQWSLHIEPAPGQLEHAEFLDLSGALPARPVAEALLEVINTRGCILTYTSFERTCLTLLAQLCPNLAGELRAVMERLVDLHQIAKRSYYHPAMKGSWSIKALLPAIAPDMDYARLEGVQEGRAAQNAYFEAIDPRTSAARKNQLGEQLLRYCAHDTMGMVRIARFLM